MGVIQYLQRNKYHRLDLVIKKELQSLNGPEYGYSDARYATEFEVTDELKRRFQTKLVLRHKQLVATQKTMKVNFL